MKIFFLLLTTITSLVFFSKQADAEIQKNKKSQLVKTVEATRHDKSLTLPELLNLVEQKSLNKSSSLKFPPYVAPNFLNHFNESFDTISKPPADIRDQIRGTINTPMPPLIISVDGIAKIDRPFNPIILPPDTNGDVGIQYYVQYINTSWAIFDKSSGSRLGEIMQGNTFWAGFGGECEGDNAGDPIVLFDKLANVWLFSQFVSPGSADANNGGKQCFAISDRADLLDPNVTFNRYEFTFDNVFNDYPHVAIWTDESGQRSGYYLVTHDFSLPISTAEFQHATFSVFERDAMIAGQVAQFVSVIDTEAFGVDSYAAQAVHLESSELPPTGMCAPFVHNHSGEDGSNGSYVLWQLCVDWNNTNLSHLSVPYKLPANGPFTYVDTNDIPQPAPAPAGSELSNFAAFTMYRASGRAYPSPSGRPVELVINHSTNVGDGISGIRWALFSLPHDFSAADIIFQDGFEPTTPIAQEVPFIIDQGVLSPDDEYRWMGAISLDQSGNIGMAYSVASSTTFPSVRYTGRTTTDPAGQMRIESDCVIGGGAQTFVSASGRAGRWGDYSSMSIDPVDQCTFWSSVEYKAVTGDTNWENRICSFRFQDCGDADFVLRSNSMRKIEVCTTQDPDPTIDLEAFTFAGFTDSVTLSGIGFQGSSAVSFSNNPLTTFPASSMATLTNLANAGTNNMLIQINGHSNTPLLDKSIDYEIDISNGTAAAVNLTSPGNASTEISVRPELTWDLLANAKEYSIEIAADSGFNTIIESGTSLINSYTTQVVLDDTTQYYWRVTTSNQCGNGTTSVVFSFTTGVAGACPSGSSENIVYSDNLEGDVSAWTMSFGTGSNTSTDTWLLSNTHVQSGVNAFAAISPFAGGVIPFSDQFLISPSITLPNLSESPITLSFWNFQNIAAISNNSCDDGALLEISTDGGVSFEKITGELLITDLYNNFTRNHTSITPLPNELTWCANTNIAEYGDQEDISVVNLDAYAGQNVQFRFRLAGDIIPSTDEGGEGWWVDDIIVKGCN